MHGLVPHFLLPISTFFFSSLAGLCNPARHPKARLLVRVNASAIAIYVRATSAATYVMAKRKNCRITKPAVLLFAMYGM